MKQIPKIIHQIWSDIEKPLPGFFSLLSNTWKENHPDWKYEFWDDNKMNDFIQNYYPQYLQVYVKFNYNIQRWDAVRYLILLKIGGMYVDFDYECIEPLDEILKNKTCCFSLEPIEHAKKFDKDIYFNNAFMASVPEHPFMKLIVDSVFNENNLKIQCTNMFDEVLTSTGPLKITSLYDEYDEKDSISLIPAALLSPLTQEEVRSYLMNDRTEEFNDYLEEKLKTAIAVHYFISIWLLDDQVHE